MRLIIFTGFLGVGKTTALLSLAGYLSAGKSAPRQGGPQRTDGAINNAAGQGLEGPAAGESIVIIENEIGQANVDGRLLAGSSYEVRDLTAGCICCTLSGQLIAALEDICATLNPDWLLIEATGIAHQTIADVVSQSGLGLKPFSIVLADAERWDDLLDKIPMLIMTQLERADLILLNKVDAVAGADLAAIEADLAEINSRSPRFNISAAGGDLDAVWSKVVDCAKNNQ